MDGKTHSQLAQLTLDLLPSEEREFWSAKGDLAKNFTNYPDIFGFCGPTYNEKRLDSLDPDWRRFVIVKGAHAHYYSYHISQPEIAVSFLEDFLGKIIASLQEKKFEEARKYAGSLMHCLQDASSPAHSAEEYILRAFAPPPTFWKNRSLHSAIESGRRISSRPLYHKPKLLGTDLKQSIFHAFYEIYNMHRKSLGMAVPILISIYEGREKKANSLFNKACRACIPVCADLLYTFYLLAQDKIRPKDKRNLEKCDLRSLRPITIEQDQNYYDYTVDFSRDIYHSFKPAPFRMLVKENGKIKEKRFKYGIGMMTDSGARTKDYHAKFVYYLYPEVYNRFQAKVGLHYELVGNAKVKISIFADKKKVFSSVLTEGDPACEIDVSIKGVEKFTLFAGRSNPSATFSLAGNKSIVWANPFLVK